jgi:hypothetical protein
LLNRLIAQLLTSNPAIIQGLRTEIHKRGSHPLEMRISFIDDKWRWRGRLMDKIKIAVVGYGNIWQGRGTGRAAESGYASRGDTHSQTSRADKAQNIGPKG